jgi:hypothetical protein
MRTTRLVSSCLALTSILVLGSSGVYAKIHVNLQTYYSEEGISSIVEQWDTTTGSKVLRYNVIDGFGSLPESVDAIAMGPDGYLYAALNNLGQIDLIRLNTATGQTVVPTDYVCCGVGVPFASFFGGPVYVLEFDPHGDLFGGHVDWMTGSPDDPVSIRRIDGSLGTLKGEVSLGPNRFILGIDFASDGESFFVLHGPLTYLPGQGAREVSIYSYSATHDIFTETSSFLVGLEENDLRVGPDNLLYISNPLTNGVDRYTTAGAYVDEFIEEYVYDLHWLEGEMIGLTPDGRVVKFDPIDGSIIMTLIDASNYAGLGTLQFYGMSAFSVIPEPSAVCLMMCWLPALVRPLSRKRR